MTFHRDAEAEPHLNVGEARLRRQHVGLQHAEPPGVELRVQGNAVYLDGGKQAFSAHLPTADPYPSTWRAQNLGRAGPGFYLRELAPGDEARVLRPDEAEHTAQGLDSISAGAHERRVLRGGVVEHHGEIEIALAGCEGGGAGMAMSRVDRLDSPHARKSAAHHPRAELACLSI